MHMKIIWFLIAALGFFKAAAAGGEEVKPPEKKIVYFLPCFWGNDIFNPKVKTEGFYDLEPLYRLHQIADQAGYDLRIGDGGFYRLRDLHGQQPQFPTTFDSVVVFEVIDHQLKFLEGYPSEKLVLFLWEPPTTMPNNYLPENHKIFSRVYTWRDDLVDNKKYFKIFYPVLRPLSDNPNEFEKRKLCVLVAANKNSWAENELYSERRKTIEFFENNHPEDFDLFGGGWPESYKTYRGGLPGSLGGKVEKLKGYKFALAYENGKEIPGYVTEKIFDCFSAGVVPIYWGAPNVTSYIPKNCFVAREDFKSHEELYAFLTAMTKEQYMEYLKNIRTFLASDQAQVFSSDNFVKIMMEMLTRPVASSETVKNSDVSEKGE